MINSISTTDSTFYKDSVRDTLVAKGLIGVIHYDAFDDIVFTLVEFPGVIRIRDGEWHYGDSWTSTTTIENPLPLLDYYSTISSGMACVMVTWSGGFAISLDNTSSPGVLVLVFTSNSAAGKIVLAFGASSSSLYNNTYCYDLTTKEGLFPALRPSGMLTDASGFFYSIDFALKNNAGVLKTASVTGVKLLLKSPEANTHTVYGNDVSVPANYTSDGANFLGASLLLVGGNL